MKIHIEIWVEEQKLSLQVRKLFGESVICYKHGANRASLLFSYLGFITHIKETLVQSNNPNPSQLGRWQNIQNEIQDDDKWEKRVFEELTNSTNPIFDIKEDLRQQIKYWKDRRNDCAHYKSNDIESHSVETFWSFIKSNIRKITVEGGRASLINKFENHFDATKTPPNTPFDSLINEIPGAVELSEFDSFLDELGQKLDPIGFYEHNLLKIHNKIFELSPADYKNKLSAFLKIKNIDLEFISKYQDKINSMDYDPSEIRQIWKTRLFTHYNQRVLFEIYASLLRNGLIPDDQTQEALEHLFDNFEQTKHSMPNDIHVKAQLINPKLEQIVFQKAIIENDLSSFMWVNSKCDFIAFYVEHFPLKTETVKSICEMVERSNYSFWLESKIQSILKANSTLKSSFDSIASQANISVPNQFQ